MEENYKQKYLKYKLKYLKLLKGGYYPFDIDDPNFINPFFPNSNPYEIFIEENNTFKIINKQTINLNKICDFLSKKPAIITLILSNNQLSNINILSTFLKTNNTITSLDLSNNDLKDLSSLGESLRYNSSLTQLNLSNNKIDENNANLLFQMFKNNTSLTSLDLSNNRIRNIDFLYPNYQEMDELLNLSNLTELNLYNNRLTSLSNLDEIIRQVPTFISLTSLNLGLTRLNLDGIQQLSNILKYNNTITELNLCDNMFFEEERMDILCSGLEQNSSLVSLDLSNSFYRHLYSSSDNILDINRLSNALKINSSIAVLNLSDNHIDDLQFKDLCEALKVNSSITELNLSYNNITHLSILKSVLLVNSTLTKINLLGNHILRSEINDFADFLQTQQQHGNPNIIISQVLLKK